MKKFDIFLSYSHKNKNVIDQLYDILTSTYKFKVWRDNNCLELGEDAYEQMLNGILNSKIIVCCFSKDYLDSTDSIREFKIASNKKIFWIPLMIEKVDIENHTKTAWHSIGIQRCNIYKNKEDNPPLNLWDGDRFKKFIDRIKKQLEASKLNIKSSLYDAYISYEVGTAHRSNKLDAILTNNGFNIHREPLKINKLEKDFECTKNAIDNSAVFICCYTNTYSKNDVCMRELDYADRNDKAKLIALFENCEDLLGDLKHNSNIINMYEDQAKWYEGENSEKLNDLVHELQRMLKKHKHKHKHSKRKSKMYDVRITGPNDNNSVNTLIKSFAENLEQQLNISVSYNTNTENKQQPPNYDAVKSSQTLLAVVTSTFEKTLGCLEEASYANRNNIPITYVLDINIKKEQDGAIDKLIDQSSTQNTFTDINLLKSSIKKNVVARKIKEDVEMLNEEKAAAYVPDNEDQMAFFMAAAQGDIVTLGHLIQKGFNVNINDEIGETAMFKAVNNDKLEAVQYLCQNHGDTNITNVLGETIIFNASYNGSIKVLKYLINSTNPNINHKNDLGETALFHAVRNNKIDAVKHLCAAKINVNETDNDRKTALFDAVQEEHLTIIEFLAKNGINLNHKDQAGDTVLHIAVKNNKLNTVKCLRENGINMNIKNNDGKTALFEAVINECIEIINYLARNGSDLNCKDKSGETALHKAVNSNTFQVVKCLCELGASVNEADNDGETVVFPASCEKNSEILEYLVRKGCNINHQDNKGETALCKAIKSQNLDRLKRLCENGANIHMVDGYGETIIFGIAAKGHLKILEYLIRKGSNLDHSNKYGNTVLNPP